MTGQTTLRKFEPQPAGSEIVVVLPWRDHKAWEGLVHRGQFCHPHEGGWVDLLWAPVLTNHHTRSTILAFQKKKNCATVGPHSGCLRNKQSANVSLNILYSNSLIVKPTMGLKKIGLHWSVCVGGLIIGSPCRTGGISPGSPISGAFI